MHGVSHNQNLMAETLPVVLQADCGSRQGTEHRTVESGNLAVSFYYQYMRCIFFWGCCFFLVQDICDGKCGPTRYIRCRWRAVPILANNCHSELAVTHSVLTLQLKTFCTESECKLARSWSSQRVDLAKIVFSFHVRLVTGHTTLCIISQNSACLPVVYSSFTLLRVLVEPLWTDESVSWAGVTTFSQSNWHY